MLKKAFTTFDNDASGSIDFVEFCQALEHLGLHLEGEGLPGMGGVPRQTAQYLVRPAPSPLRAASAQWRTRSAHAPGWSVPRAICSLTALMGIAAEGSTTTSLWAPSETHRTVASTSITEGESTRGARAGPAHATCRAHHSHHAPSASLSSRGTGESA